MKTMILILIILQSQQNQGMRVPDSLYKGFIGAIVALIFALLAGGYTWLTNRGKPPATEQSTNLTQAYSGLACPKCDTPYRESDYRADAPIWTCSVCRGELPKGAVQ